MTDYLDKTYLLVAKREDEHYPLVIGAMPASTRGIIFPEEWDAWKRKRGEEMFNDDWTAYDYIEVIVTIPNAQLAELFAAHKITPSSIEVAP